MNRLPKATAETRARVDATRAATAIEVHTFMSGPYLPSIFPGTNLLDQMENISPCLAYGHRMAMLVNGGTECDRCGRRGL